MTTRAARKATPARRPPAKPLDQRVERAPGSGERARAGGHDRRQDAEAEGPAHLLGGDDQAGPEALVGLVPPGGGGDRDGHVGEHLATAQMTLPAIATTRPRIHS